MTTVDNVPSSKTVAAAQCIAPGGAGAPADGPTATPLLPEPAGWLGSGSMTALAALLTRADEQDRTDARSIEDASEKAAAGLEAQRVQEMNSKAASDLDGAIAGGIGEIVGGSLTAASGVVPSSGAADASASTDATDWRAVLRGAGQAAPGAGSIVAGSYKADADADDAGAAMADAEAQAEIRREGRAHEDFQAADDSIRKVCELLQGVQQAQNQASATASAIRA